MRPAPWLLAPALLLSGCVETGMPAPVLEFVRLDATHTRVLLTPAPALPLRWTVQEAEECGGEQNGPPVAFGLWPAPAPAVEVQAWRGHLFTVEAQGMRLADCVPPLSWNSAQNVRPPTP